MVKKPRKKQNTSTNMSGKGSLVKGFVPPVSRSLLEFDSFKREVKDMLKHHSGVYVLYNKNQLYYVGLATDLFSRLYHHTRDKHKNKWNKFSVFIIARGKYLKDIESMIHRISVPAANLWKGKFKGHYKYDRRIKKMVNETFKKIAQIQRNA